MAGSRGASSRVVVVTGTDTGVGKTFVTCALARALVAQGKRVVAVKLVESGCGGAPDHEDGRLLARATGQREPDAALVRLRAPVAPALAADLEDVAIDVPSLLRQVRELGAGADVVLVEGAGGALSPLTWKEDITDVARALEARVLLVAANRLGVLHHVRAALRVLEGAGLPVLGVVLSTRAEDESTPTNADALSKVAGASLRVAVVSSASCGALGPVCDWIDRPPP